MDDYAREERGKIVDAEKKDAWEKINKYLSIFDGNPNFKNDVETVPELADVFKMSIMQEIFGWKSYKDPKTTIDDVVDLSNDKKKRPAMAAAMLAMMKKTKGLYTKMTRFEDQGMRVKMLLWESKRREYMAQRAKIEADIAAWRGDRKILQNLLARAEVEFIMNDINRDERDYFGCTKGDKNYQNNLPFAFATELDNRFKECYSTAKRDEERKEKAEQSFWIAKDSFYGNLKKGKEVYIGDLGAAMEQTKTEQDHKDIQIMMLTFLLSWKSDLNMRKENKKYFIKLARTYSFAPWLILENRDVVSYTLEFLKQIDPQLVMDLKGQTKGAQTQTEEIRKILEKRFDTGDNFKKFENFLKKDFVTKQRNENPKMKEIKEKFEEDGDIDPSLKDNDDITNYRGLNSTPTAVDNARGFSKGSFTGDADAQGRKKDFWKRIQRDVESFGNTKDEIIYLYNQFTKVFFPKGSEGKRVIKLLQGNRKNKYRDKLNKFKNDIISAYFVGANIERNDVLPGEYRDALNAFIKKIKAGNNLSIIHDNCCQDCDAMSVNELVGLLTDSYTLWFKYVPYKDENWIELKRDWRRDITNKETKKFQNDNEDDEDDEDNPTPSS